MADQEDTAESPAVGAPETAPPEGEPQERPTAVHQTVPGDTGDAGAGPSPLEAQRRAEQNRDAFAERPHLFVAGAFLGGLVFAQILKRFAEGDDD
jgi:hypothetical protein